MKIKFLTLLCLAVALFMTACGKSDADLQKAVEAKLKADNVAGVTVTVKDGVATLSGEVADAAVKNKADASAKSVEGIKSTVTTGVTLKPLPTPAAPPADPALKAKLDENLKKAGCTGVTIDVKDGTVTAGGTVPKGKLAECVQTVQQSGLGKMVNNIQESK
jgi:hyperosmotically inducible periplasmic protein